MGSPLNADFHRKSHVHRSAGRGMSRRSMSRSRRFTRIGAKLPNAHHHCGRPLPGWRTDTTRCRTWTDLPPAARTYVERLEELAGVPVTHVSVGPERAQMIVR